MTTVGCRGKIKEAETFDLQPPSRVRRHQLSKAHPQPSSEGSGGALIQIEWPTVISLSPRQVDRHDETIAGQSREIDT